MTLLLFHWLESAMGVFDNGTVARYWVGGGWYNLTLMGFFVANTLLVGRWFRNIEEFHVTTQLWRLFIIGMGGITIIMVTTFANRSTASLTIYPYLSPVFFCLSLYALVIFFLSSVFIYRRFILYPRTRNKIITWYIFLGFLVFALLQPFVNLGIFILVSFGLFLILSLILSANVRWIAYLNFNQKLRALGLSSLIMLVIITYVLAARTLPERLGIISGETLRIEFVYYIMLFAFCYTGSSILVLFFNLPTTSIFEKQSVEIASFSKINQAIQSNLDFGDIMNTLLDASLMAANAKAGWIELLTDTNGKAEINLKKKIESEDILSIKQQYDITEKVIRDQQFYLVRNLRKHRAFLGNNSKYKSLLSVPIVSTNQAYGAVFVVNELHNSFEDVNIQSVIAFAEQAGMALENARLMKESLETESYRTQMKIASEFQKKLLPRQLPFTDQIEFVSLSETAYEIGGDYFDVVHPAENIYRVAIGDVSGKGTTAAFYMAEVKGIFHALTQLDLDVKQFVQTANDALSACMQRKFFMSLTYLEINVAKKTVEMIRAGHCPTYYYEAATDQLKECREGTIGLAIIRNKSFARQIQETQRIQYQAGDFMVLYTDGITEARNEAGEEFGYERLQSCILRLKQESSTNIAAGIVHSVKAFAQSDPQDDYTVLIIKFG
ncbi:MAG: GAF domain-containing SpoIIE family protein phosphatase [Bacteroidota bacterium]